MTHRRSDEMGAVTSTPIPDHYTILGLWEVAMESVRERDIPIDVSVLVAPSNLPPSDIIAVVNLSGEDGPDPTIDHYIAMAKAHGIIADPCKWLAVAVPCYVRPSEVLEDATSGELRQQFIDGDPDVHQAVAVFIGSQGLLHRVEPEVLFRVFLRPLLDEATSQSRVMPAGVMRDAIIRGLVSANEP